MSGLSRRNFIKVAAGLGAAGALMPLRSFFSGSHLKGLSADLSAAPLLAGGSGTKPLVISTWKHGLPANDAAWKVLEGGGAALDAVEAGVRVPEGDPNVMSVGYGGLPDEDCKVTLDASIMASDGRAGSVAFVQGYKHPISIARKVMEATDHVMIVGEGAEEFARKNGFQREDILTDAAREAWIKWKQKMSEEDDWFPKDLDHDTIGMVAIDAGGNLAGACTTSGLAFKIHGRVGDSPIIGAGMYVDNEVGAAAATGKGEEVIKICGSFLVVEGLRQGLSPKDACKRALERILKKHGAKPTFQVAFIALSKEGEIGALSLQQGFQYALAAGGTNELVDAEHLL
ncbi:MAG: N(4)-(beta-N-acetylglucosaminyl)-L-asparaginase [Candidatus Krumholzibacteria bacterium]|nr:N(4)-(beta-N-acetylglucosaminyl)-L-asparaginase [Candidatus Krumholzibacteria bacterium]